MDAHELKPWNVLERRLALDASPWLKVWVETVQLPDGRIVEGFHQLEQPDYVEIFALTGNDRIIGLWRYKHGPRAVNLGLPAGYLNPGELPLEAARRELMEETGYQASEWKELGSFVVDGNRGLGRAHLFLAQGLVQIAEPDPEDLEEIRMELIHLADLRRYLQDGTVSTLGAAATVALALNTIDC